MYLCSMCNVKEHKICYNCKELKPFSEYYTSNRSYKKKNGETSTYKILNARCIVCTKLITRSIKATTSYKERKKQYNTINKKIINDHRRNSVNSRINAMLSNARRRAKKRGVLFDLHPSDIVIPEKCPLLGITLIWGSKGDYENTPSLDRINPKGGYTIDNVRVISKKANSMKNSATLDEMQVFVQNIIAYMNIKKI